MHGAYLTKAADCVACHTVKDDAPFAGGLPFDTPVGRVYSTNITPDQQHGIGGHTLKQFVLAMREGVRKDGARLYPYMPFTSYAKVSHAADDSTLKAILAGRRPGAAPASISTVARRVIG